MILAIYDVSGIQQYIFASSRMRENIGASKIVGEVLDKHLPEVLKEYFLQSNQEVVTDWDKDEQKFSIGSQDTVQAEIIYTGGGNAIVAYRNERDYHAINKALAKRLIEVSYTLSLAVAAIQTDFGDFAKDKALLEEKLKDVKSRMIRQRPTGVFPISEQEGMTGLPITGLNYNPVSEQFDRVASTLQRLKSEASHPGRKEVIPFPEEITAFRRWGYEMDELIQKKGENSYVAVVHIDGNGMGKQLREKLKKETEGKNYAESVMTMRKLSKQISTEYQRIFNEVMIEVSEMQSDGDHPDYLPIRPLIMDGDDLTFVCQANWGVPLAAKLLHKLEQSTATMRNEGLSLSACAGVALVHSHFPFHIAYEVAEECCKHAKKKRSMEQDQHAFIDFRIVRGSNPQDDINEAVMHRPYRITGDMSIGCDAGPVEGTRTDDFSFLAGCVQQLSADKWPRSRLEKLYAAYLGRPEELKLYVDECQSRGYSLQALYGQSKDHDGDEPYLFDALEVMDVFNLQMLG